MRRIARITILLAILIFAAVYINYFFHGYLGLSDGNDYAGLARSIVRGDGFSLGHLYPLALVFNQTIPQPDNMWAPAYPVYLALFFFIFGVNDTAILAATIVAVWFLILIAYYATAKFVGDGWGILSAALTGLNQSVLKVALEGSPEVLTAGLILLSFVMLFGKSRGLRVVLSALIFGMAVLTRYQIVFLAIPLLIFMPGRTIKTTVIWVVVFAAALSPWLVRNAYVFGNPFFTLQTYGEFTKGMGHLKYYYMTYRSLTPMTLGYALTNFPLYVFKKFAAGNILFVLNFPTIVNFFGIVPLAYALWKISSLNEWPRKFIAFSIISLIVVIEISSLDGHHWRHLVNLQGVMAVSVAVGLLGMRESVAVFRGKYIFALVVALMLFPARFPFQEMELSKTAVSVDSGKANYRLIASETKTGDVIISDASDAVWWYADRSSIWIPIMYRDLKKVMEIAGSDYVYLEDTSNYFGGLSNDELADFHTRMTQVDGIPGGWGFFKREIVDTADEIAPGNSTKEDSI